MRRWVGAAVALPLLAACGATAADRPSGITEHEATSACKSYAASKGGAQFVPGTVFATTYRWRHQPVWVVQGESYVEGWDRDIAWKCLANMDGRVVFFQTPFGGGPVQ